MKIPFRSKEESWLSFNARVLQEAADPAVPLLERIKFLGIYSSNLDEFFRVRVATLKRLALLGDHWRELNIPNPGETFRAVNTVVAKQARDFNGAFADIVTRLAKAGIRVLTDREVPENLQEWLTDYFRTIVRPHLMPVMLKSTEALPNLRDVPMYLAVLMTRTSGKGRPAHSLIEIPSILPRFVVLPAKGRAQMVMFLDDIIRYGMSELFSHLPYDKFDAWALKFTRDAEMDFDDDFTESVFQKVTEGVKAREEGLPVRANYDAEIPGPFLRLLLNKLGLSDSNSVYPGARYHNRKDLIGFPTLGRSDLLYPKSKPLDHYALERLPKEGFFPLLRKRDVLLHFPYHSFSIFIDLLREAAIDPLVQSIRLTQYRLAKSSCVARALVCAARNGKEVTVLVEPQARFDEKANISWAGEYRDAGVRVILGVPKLKVHAKLALISRKEIGRTRYYAALATGNLNEDSARVFADHMLLTSDQEVGRDVASVFDFFDRNYRPPHLTHLLSAPFSLREWLRQRIDKEISEAAAGRVAMISLKLNNLSDEETIQLLLRAAEAGVKIRLIIRSMFSLIVDHPNIEAICVVDKYLEHSRILWFHNGGEPLVYLSSADFLQRNFDTRVEIIFPLRDPTLAAQLRRYFEIHWSDNRKARILDRDLTNRFRRRTKGSPEIRAQFAIEEYLRGMH